MKKIKKSLSSMLLLVMVSFITFSCNNTDDAITLEANFETSLQIENNQAKVELTNLSVGAISYLWTFEGAENIQTSILEQPEELIYTTNGTYRITLVITNGNSTDSFNQEITINGLDEDTDTDDDELNASFETNLVVEQNQAIVTVNNTSIGANSYQWTFQNGSPEVSSEENPGEIIYTENGTYTITLEVTDGVHTDTESTTVTINGIGDSSSCIEGEGASTTTIIDGLGTFSKIELKSTFDVNITEGNTHEVEVTGYENLIAYLDFIVEEDVLILQFEEGCYSNVNLEVNVSLPSLAAITNDGTGDISVKSSFAGMSNLELNIKGTGVIQTVDTSFDINDKLTATLAGTGAININGVARNLEVTHNGTGSFKAFGLQTEEAIVNSNATGDTEVNVSNTLNVTIGGVGNIYYKGQPTINSTITGTGQLIDAN
ncbi:GIN domain-containing protein [Aquimarina rhabdastrellae]